MWSAASLLPAAAQEVTTGQAFDGLFAELARLQDASVATAREIAEAQRHAAAVLQAAIDTGAVSSPADVGIAQALAANARTLASIALVPLVTDGVATGDVLLQLLRQNVVLLHSAAPGSEGGLAAFKEYEALQARSEELAVALQDAWARYRETMTAAAIVGSLRPGSFNPSDRTWTLSVPAAGSSPSRYGDLEFNGGADPAEVYQGVGIVAPDAAGATPSSTDEAPGPALPHPSLAETATAQGDAASGAETGTAAQPGWTTNVTAQGLTRAAAPNLNQASSERIKSMVVDCHPNGTLRYTLEAQDEFAEYRVYANDVDYAVVQASGNVVAGGQALRMSDALRLAFEWASRDPAGSMPMVITPNDEPELRAEFSVAGYLEARGKVLDACVPRDDNSDSPPAAAAVEAEERPSAAPIPYPRPKNRL